MNGDRTPLNMEENLESSGSYNSLPDETRRPGQLERAFRRRTVRDVLSLVDDLDAKAEFAPLERAYVVYSVLKTRQYADDRRDLGTGTATSRVRLSRMPKRPRRPTGARPTSRTATPSGGSRSGAARTHRGEHMYISTHGESRTPRRRATTVHRTK